MAAEDVMKAIVQDRYGSPDVLALRDVGKPVVEDDEGLGRGQAAGVNIGDWDRLRGVPYVMRLVFGVLRPRCEIPGLDLAGRVEAVGTKVKRFRAGDEVFGWCKGAFAEYACTAENNLLPKPANLTFEQSAAVGDSAFTALAAVHDHGKVQPGQRVLINGASGGVGTFAVQIAKSLGANVTGVCSTRNVDLVKSLGADHVIDYTKEDFTKSAERYDVMLDNVGNHSLSECKGVLTPDGKYVLIGGGGASDQGFLGGLGKALWAMVFSKFVNQQMGMMMADANHNDLAILADMMQSGKLKPVIDRTYKLEQVPDAIRYVEQGHARGKVVITVE